MNHYAELQECVITGQHTKVVEITQRCMDEGAKPKDILNDGLLPGMKVVGQKFNDGEFFIPEMLMAARALNHGLDLIRPLLEATDLEPVARVVVGTVKGDIHDIGKNLVAVMLRGNGFEVFDAGVDVPPDRFVELARENNADIVGLSAMLTTTMPSMKDTIDAFVKEGMRDSIKIVIGGAPVSDGYAKQIGADGYARNSSTAVDMVKNLIGVEP